MVQISDLPQWLSLSSQLIQASPNTTRITTKYTIGRNKRKAKDGKGAEEKKTKEGEESTASKRNGTFTIKTHDTASGSTLVFKTNKAADMGMIMRSMNGLGADLAGLERSKAPAAIAPAAEAAAEAIKDDEDTPVGSQTPAQVAEDGEKAKSKKKKKAKSKR